ncbi:MAG: glutamate synthase subunit beta [Bacteroides sp.]|jgi:glutamate synthase (NADPH/NADH) small chain|nr:glutamate synthase subunit beta [Bacteroides sp.]MDD6908112.1 glutamate synthase subunit beta [Bacteroidaceae bacterium]
METSKAFLNIPRQEAGYRPVEDRITDFSQVEQTLNSRDRKLQASRCMDCGVPFCHWACPLGNKDPEFQAALSQGKWEMAYRILSQTNDFPEFTGRICPALCEKSCVLKLSFDAPVTIRENEAAIAEAAFREGYIQPQQPVRNGKRVAVIGAGPAGLSTAVRLNAQGFEVTIFDKNPMPGGLLRYGIPNFKLPKEIIDRRMRLLKKEGIHMEMGVTVDVEKLPEGFDAYALCTGTPEARDLNIPGRELKGIYFALDMLAQQNRILDGETFSKEQLVNARGKKVLVIGGGDTGSDCIGTSIRQGAVSVTQIEIMPKPPVGHNPATPWPQWPVVLKTTSSHEEGCTRRWSLNSTKFIGRNGRVTGVEVEEVEWITDTDSGRPVMKATGKKEIIEADMVLLAMGFLKPRHPELPSNVVIAGDAATGASLVVKCLADGRRAAKDIEQMLSEKEK